jgi:hypothetical protein
MPPRSGRHLKILTGAKPVEMLVEQPTKYELVVNLKASNPILFT